MRERFNRRNQFTAAAPPEQAVKQALIGSGYGDLRHLDVFHNDGRIRVAGRVRSYFMKQKAQTIAMSVAPDQLLLNEVVVR
jgi:hypothetical protein